MANIKKEKITFTKEEMFTEMDLYGYYVLVMPKKISSLKTMLTPKEWYEQIRSKGAILPKPKTQG